MEKVHEFLSNYLGIGMQAIYIIGAAVYLIAAFVMVWIWIRSIHIESYFWLRANKPKRNYTYEFKARLSSHYALFLDPQENNEYIFRVDTQDYFREEHFYSWYKITNISFGFLGSPLYPKYGWHQCTYP